MPACWAGIRPPWSVAGVGFEPCRVGAGTDCGSGVKGLVGVCCVPGVVGEGVTGCVATGPVCGTTVVCEA